MAKHQFMYGNKFGKGRPQGSSYSEECKQWAKAGGWERLFAWADGRLGASKNIKLQFEALRLILAYAYGKPKDISETTVDLGLAERMEAAELRLQKEKEGDDNEPETPINH